MKFLRKHHLPRDEVTWIESIDDGGTCDRRTLVAPRRVRYGLPHTEQELVDAYRREIPRLARCFPGVPTRWPSFELRAGKSWW